MSAKVKAARAVLVRLAGQLRHVAAKVTGDYMNASARRQLISIAEELEELADFLLGGGK